MTSTDVTPAWQRDTVGEQRWPVALVVLVIICAQLALPTPIGAIPKWLAPAIQILLVVVIFALNPTSTGSAHRMVRPLGLALCVLLTLGNIHEAVMLILSIVNGQNGLSAGALFASGAIVWFCNIVVFALWYWELDRGGPLARAQGLRKRPDFLFTQMQAGHSGHDQDWEPCFFDYLYVAFTNATAFSPTDTMPLSVWAKMMMMCQAFISLTMAAVVIARAIGVLS